MNISDARELYTYLAESRKSFLNKLLELGWEEATRDRGATWGSMQGVFVHLLEVEDSWLHYDIPGKLWPYGDRDPSAFKDFNELEAYNRELSERTKTYLSSLTLEELRREVSYDVRGSTTKSTVENILIHTCIDEIAHIGELICLMWQLDVKPPYIDWIKEHSKPA